MTTPKIEILGIDEDGNEHEISFDEMFQYKNIRFVINNADSPVFTISNAELTYGGGEEAIRGLDE